MQEEHADELLLEKTSLQSAQTPGKYEDKSVVALTPCP
jgi:hypothetical protein